MPLSEPKYHEVRLRLADARVDAVVVGMAAAVIQGAPTMTWDLDIVHHRTPQNVERLPGVLSDIDSRRLRPNASHLLRPGHILLKARLGDFDSGRPKDLAGIPYIKAIAELSRQTVNAVRFPNNQNLRTLDFSALAHPARRILELR